MRYFIYTLDIILEDGESVRKTIAVETYTFPSNCEMNKIVNENIEGVLDFALVYLYEFKNEIDYRNYMTCTCTPPEDEEKDNWDEFI